MSELESDDIQGLVLRGFGRHDAARFFLLRIDPTRVAAARAYLRELDVNLAQKSPDHVAAQVAFTRSGLGALNVPDHVLKTFSREFLEGMHEEHRAIALGDQEPGQPRTWDWTGATVHALLMIYARDERTLDTHLDAERPRIAAAFEVVVEKTTHARQDHKEHFGWRDGISTPEFARPDKAKKKAAPPTWTPPDDPIAVGEFVLGYPNEYKVRSESPTALLTDDSANCLPPTPDGQHKDLGKNGTYLVYREIEQKVKELWSYLAKESREGGDGADAVARATALGAKMVGRWPSGAPLVLSEKTDDAAQATANAFTYADQDRPGTKCPIGAHIRRANPRDALFSDREPPESVTMVRKHQMIRRGRPFGPPVADTMLPKDILAAPADSEVRGLHFICLVGNISRQFEFVQRNWIQSANFAGLYKDGDPIVGPRRAGGENINDQFTCPAVPVRRKYKGMPEFTRLMGGAYFFLPSLRALRFIAQDR